MRVTVKVVLIREDLGVEVRDDRRAVKPNFDNIDTDNSSSLSCVGCSRFVIKSSEKLSKSSNILFQTVVSDLSIVSNLQIIIKRISHILI